MFRRGTPSMMIETRHLQIRTVLKMIDVHGDSFFHCLKSTVTIHCILSTESSGIIFDSGGWLMIEVMCIV